jgi:hypothetical protein
MHLLELALVVWLGGNLVLGSTLWAMYLREGASCPSLEALQSIEFVPPNSPLLYPVVHTNIELLRRMAYGEMDEAASPHPHCTQRLTRKQT